MKQKNSSDVPEEQQVESLENDEREDTPASDSENESGLNRRKFLIAGIGAAAVITTSHTLIGAQNRRRGQGGGGQGQGGGQGRGPGRGPGQGGGGGNVKPPPYSALNLSTSATSPTFREPEVAEARTVGEHNSVKLTLTAALTKWRFSCGGSSAYGLIPIYNSDVPGPTIIVDPGSRINITLVNNLIKDDSKMWPGDHCGQMVMDGTKPTPPECFMHTNLHTHGLMVSPSSVLNSTEPNQKPQYHCIPATTDNCGPLDSGKILCASDDVLADIAPGGGRCNYGIVLPDFHEPGTYWYHSHVHGSTGYQVSSGMAGAIIIREPVGQELVQPDRDKVFLMQEVIFTPPQQPAPPTPGASPSPTPTATPVQVPPVYTEQSTTQYSAGFLINGQCKPTLQMKTGQTQRWRFINGTGTPRGLMKLRLIKMSNDPSAVIKDSDVFDCGNDPTDPGTTICPVKPALNKNNAIMYLIAVDGISFFGFPPQPVRQHLIAAGNRADFLINIPAAVTSSSGRGKYVLVKDGFPKDAENINLTPSLNDPDPKQCALNLTVPASLRTNQVLAYIEVYDNASDVIEQIPTVIPGTRPAYLTPIASVDNPTADRVVAFVASNPSGSPGGGNFSINGGFYDPESLGIVAKLNTAEEWLLTNEGNDIPHPFHIHVNPFQIVGRTIDFEVEPADRTPNNPPLDPNNPANWIWQDTVAIPAQIPVKRCGDNLPGQIKLRTRFLVYPGEYVLHCHILIHEDLGMMTNVTIQDDGNGVGPCQTLVTYPPASLACINRTSPPAPAAKPK